MEMVRRSVDAWNRGDIEGWLHGAHPEIEWTPAVANLVEGPATVCRGPTEMRRFWDELRGVWSLTVEISDFRDLGDTVLAIGRIRMRGVASEVELESPIAYVYEFEDGLARTARAYLDPDEAIDAVA